MLKINQDEIKIIISDFDGTLRPHGKGKRNSQNGIPKLNIEEIKKACDQGCYFVLNTGNLPYEMKASVELLGPIREQTKYIIACNGNAIENYLTKKVVIKTFFDHQTLLKFVEIFNQISDANYDLTSEDLEYIYYNQPGYKQWMIDLKLNEVDQFHRLDLTPEILKSFQKCPKVTFHNAHPQTKQAFIEKILKTFCHLDITPTWFTDSGVDFQIQGPNKFNAIQDLLELINQENKTQWTLNNVLYFGDHHNDLDVFKNLKYSIAMGNAIDEIKTLAYEITENDAAGGVGKYLQKITQV